MFLTVELPPFVTTIVYDSFIPGRASAPVRLVLSTVFDTDSADLDASMSVLAVALFDVTVLPDGAIPFAVTAFTTDPAAMSPAVIAYVAVAVVCSPGASVVFPSFPTDAPLSSSASETPVTVELPLLRTVIV